MSGRVGIREAVVVEGRDDAEVVKRAVDAMVIVTHGYGISAETWGILEKAYHEKGLVILTDPDHAGEEIRRRLTEKFPDAKQAFLTRGQANRDGDIGVENADPTSVARAIADAHVITESDEDPMIDHVVLAELGLIGRAGSAELRSRVAKELGIGYGNGRAFLRKLNAFNISAEDLRGTVDRIGKDRK